MCNFEFLQVIIAFFSKTVWPMNMKFGLHRVSIWANIQKNFKFLGRTVSEKNAMLTLKFQSCLLVQLCKFEFLQVMIAFFSKTVWPRNMKFGLHRVSIWVNIQKIFKFLGRTVSEKNAMLTCKISKLFIRANVQLWIFASYHRIFLENCVTEEHEILFAMSIHMG